MTDLLNVVLTVVGIGAIPVSCALILAGAIDKLAAAIRVAVPKNITIDERESVVRIVHEEKQKPGQEVV